jgi:ADP-heptose:LPS heptosyltransferase
MILVLRALGVGDLATAVPALRGLRAAHPGDVLALAAPGWLAPLVELTGAVDRIIPLDGISDEAALATRRDTALPGLAVNLHGRGPQSHRLLRRTRPGRLIAYASAEAGHADGPGWRDDEHEVARWCRLLRWYGVPADPGDLGLRRPAGRHPAGLTIVHPGAKAPERRWPVRRFAAVAGALAGAGHRVVVTGSAAERKLAAAVASLAGLPPSASLAGRTDTGGLAGLVAGARLVVSGDTGIAHLATAYATPSVVLFGPVSPAHWGPPPDRPWHRALWHPAPGRSQPAGPAAGRDAGTQAHPALLAIGTAEVLAAADEAGRAASRGRVRHAVAAQ